MATNFGIPAERDDADHDDIDAGLDSVLSHDAELLERLADA